MCSGKAFVITRGRALAAVRIGGLEAAYTYVDGRVSNAPSCNPCWIEHQVLLILPGSVRRRHGPDRWPSRRLSHFLAHDT